MNTNSVILYKFAQTIQLDLAYVKNICDGQGSP